MSYLVSNICKFSFSYCFIDDHFFVDMQATGGVPDTGSSASPHALHFLILALTLIRDSLNQVATGGTLRSSPDKVGRVPPTGLVIEMFTDRRQSGKMPQLAVQH